MKRTSVGLVLLLSLLAPLMGHAQHTVKREIYTSEIREAVPGAGTAFPHGVGNEYLAGKGPAGWNIQEKLGFHSTVITLDYDMAITDAAAAGAHGSVKVYEFPEGRALLLTAHANIALSCNAVENGLTATATHEIGVGTAAAGVDNPALTGAEEDILAGAADDLTASAITYTAVNSTPAALDGTSTAKSVYVNLVFAADDSGAAGGVCNISGPLSIHWVYVGDD